MLFFRHKFLLSISFFAFVFSNHIYSQNSYEAENALLSTGTRIDSCAACSGGKKVSHIGDEWNGTVSFQVNVADEGLYAINVYFTVWDDKSLLVSVNNDLPAEIVFRTSGAPNVLSKQQIVLPLKSGQNTIRFNNPYEGAPDLDRIETIAQRLPSSSISGKITGENGQPLKDIRIYLAGAAQRSALTDSRGNYLFNNLPQGDYTLTPVSGNAFSPNDYHLSLQDAGIQKQDFKTRPSSTKNASAVSNMQAGNWRISYNLDMGTADFYFKGRKIVAGAYALVKAPASISSRDLPVHRVSTSALNDEFGKGKRYDVVSSHGSGSLRIKQSFWLYEKNDYFFTTVSLSADSIVSASYMAPLVSGQSVAFSQGGDNRTLYVPHDNDKWTRYISFPFNGKVVSNEVSAIFNNDSRSGLVAGSIEHDIWKTGISVMTEGRNIAALEMFAGNTSFRTRDAAKHGAISGKMISSPRIFIGYFADWRLGMESYAKANATIHPARGWTRGTPFGWNSWGKIQGSISAEKAIQVSDYMAKNLQSNHFNNNGTVYVGLDARMELINDSGLAAFVNTCKKNHQEAGCYIAPFIGERNHDTAIVEGTDYRYRDIYLYANGKKQVIDGLAALDPTHPATMKHVRETIERYRRLGFTYIKMDFLAHASLEADHYYDSTITTGMQAYNYALKQLNTLLGDDMYINLSIAPLFPAHYANSRRIGCDSWGDMEKTAYTLNSLSYGWWLSKVYDYNDADHVVLGDYSEGENRARVTSSVITGIFIAGDDFSDNGSELGKQRAQKYLTNPDINAIAVNGISFQPVEGNTRSSASPAFVTRTKDHLYIAVFNYGNEARQTSISLDRIGLPASKPYQVRELWSGNTQSVSEKLATTISPRDAKVFRFDLK